MRALYLAAAKLLEAPMPMNRVRSHSWAMEAIGRIDGAMWFAVPNTDAAAVGGGKADTRGESAARLRQMAALYPKGT